MTYEIGKIYKINHSRKGKFAIQVTRQCDEWVTGVIIQGMAKAMLDYNEKYEGEEITVRKSFCTILMQDAA